MRRCMLVFWTLLVVLKYHELAFSVFIASVSRDASNERINSLYSCRKYKKNRDLCCIRICTSQMLTQLLFDFAD